MSSLWYILDKENKPVEAKSDKEYSDWCTNYPNRKIVGKTNIGECFVSTLFLALDHNYSNLGKPVLWETMVFSEDKNSMYQERYTSQQDAVKGHEKVVRAVINNINLYDLYE